MIFLWVVLYSLCSMYKIVWWHRDGIRFTLGKTGIAIKRRPSDPKLNGKFHHYLDLPFILCIGNVVGYVKCLLYYVCIDSTVIHKIEIAQVVFKNYFLGCLKEIVENEWILWSKSRVILSVFQFLHFQAGEDEKEENFPAFSCAYTLSLLLLKIYFKRKRQRKSIMSVLIIY